jgi:hypothetical protein
VIDEHGGWLGRHELERLVGARVADYMLGRRQHGLEGEAACEAASRLVDAYGGETAVSWLLGRNHFLDGRAPANVLRHAPQREEVERVVDAARAFVWP